MIIPLLKYQISICNFFQYFKSFSFNRISFIGLFYLLMNVSPHLAWGEKKLSDCLPLQYTEQFNTQQRLQYIEKKPQSNSLNAPIIFAIHGLGDQGKNFARLHRYFPKTWRMIFVEGPIVYRQGFAWYRFRCLQQHSDIYGSVEALTRLVQSFSELYPKAPIAIFGFSQGGVMSIRALHLAPHLYQAVASLSGYWMDYTYGSNDAQNKIRFTQKLDVHQKKTMLKSHVPKLMIAHGKKDRVVSFTEAKKLQKKFTHEGYLIKFLTFDGAHRIPQNVIQSLIEFLSYAFKSQ
jgi:phospholipase/carboxylesterase